MATLRVGIDARLRHGEAGGVESVILGLAEGLSSLDGDEEYLFLTLRGEDHWITPHLRGNARPLPMAMHGRDRSQLRSWVKRSVRRGGPVAREVAVAVARRLGPPRSDGTIERAAVDVMHFVRQSGFLTNVPSIYHPHDLQHRHFPEFFDPWELQFRDRWYTALCAQASMVAVASSWTRADVIREMGLPAEKVRVVPWAPPIDVIPEPRPTETAKVKSALKLPDRFVFYPAQTWPHKNHIGLLRALHIIRSRGVTVPLVLSGRRNQAASIVDGVVHQLGMEDQVHWLGFVEPGVLRTVFRMSAAVIIPSKFEAASGPLWEAFALGVPAACSNVTSLPEQAGDAALIFDPNQPDEIADAILRLWTDEALCRSLAERGRDRLTDFSWDRTARHFRAHYRRLGGRPLSEDDQALLAADPLL